MFQADAIQVGIAQGLPKKSASPVRRKLVRSFLRVDGGGASSVKYSRGRLELRAEFDGEATVRVEKRTGRGWSEVYSGTSAGQGGLLKITGDVRLVVEGQPVGFALLKVV